MYRVGLSGVPTRLQQYNAENGLLEFEVSIPPNRGSPFDIYGYCYDDYDRDGGDKQQMPLACSVAPPPPLPVEYKLFAADLPQVRQQRLQKRRRRYTAAGLIELLDFYCERSAANCENLAASSPRANPTCAGSVPICAS
mmetsp:Transcript_4068/g.10335  ORF Transcript_4068/g.10335 Transcript_4068/m.10335 type:complete len:139 (+) Transcript_4068:1507-1923(+)